MGNIPGISCMTLNSTIPFDSSCMDRILTYIVVHISINECISVPYSTCSNYGDTSQSYIT